MGPRPSVAGGIRDGGCVTNPLLPASQVLLCCPFRLRYWKLGLLDASGPRGERVLLSSSPLPTELLGFGSLVPSPHTQVISLLQRSSSRNRTPLALSVSKMEEAARRIRDSLERAEGDGISVPRSPLDKLMQDQPGWEAELDDALQAQLPAGRSRSKTPE